VLGEGLNLDHTVDPEVSDRAVALETRTGEVSLRSSVDTGQGVNLGLLGTTLQVEHAKRLPNEGSHGGGARVGGGGGGGGDSVVAHVPDKIVDNGIPSTSHCGFLSLARSQ